MTCSTMVPMRDFEARVRKLDADIARSYSDALICRMFKIYGIRLKPELTNSPIYGKSLNKAFACALVNFYKANKGYIDAQADAICEKLSQDPLEFGFKIAHPGMLCGYLMECNKYPGSEDPNDFAIFIAISFSTCLKMYSVGFDAFATEAIDAITRGLLNSRKSIYKILDELFSFFLLIL